MVISWVLLILLVSSLRSASGLWGALVASWAVRRSVLVIGRSLDWGLLPTGVPDELTVTAILGAGEARVFAWVLVFVVLLRLNFGTLAVGFSSTKHAGLTSPCM